MPIAPMVQWKAPRFGTKRCSVIHKSAETAYAVSALFGGVTTVLYQQNLLGLGGFEVVHASRAVAGQVEGHKFIA